MRLLPEIDCSRWFADTDAADLADALTSGEGWAAVARCEAAMLAGAMPAAIEAAEGLHVSISSVGVAGVLEHYRQRVVGGSEP